VNSYRIASIPGDGIGVDVTIEARKVLDRAAGLHGFGLQWTQYVNLRPVRLLPGTTSALAGRSADELEMVIVRENSEGEYSEIGGRHNAGQPGEFVLQESVFTRVGVERIIRYAFDLARTRTGRVCSATKSNGLIHSMPYWDEIFARIAAEYPDVKAEQCHVDALAARMVLQPDRLDVVVGSNLFGDILSDLAAAVTGGLGMAPSGNINPPGEYPSMFEAVHGSAPDIAGQGIANPVAQILAGAMMLDHLGETVAAQAINTTVEKVLAEGAVLTPDLGGRATTTDLGKAIAEALG
jgi:tartrate dehydrogenase/decarboxylase/D-malate dehydrogenase